MKKRILSLLLAVAMLINFTPVLKASAETTDYSNSVLYELVAGSSYGIIPNSWSELDLSVPVSQGKLWVLLAGMRCKLLETDCVTKNPDIVYSTKKNMTVEEVLNTYNSLLTSMEFSIDLGLDGSSATDNMKNIGVYKGTEDEAALSDTCTIMDACIYATRIITYVYDKFDAASKGFFWVAKNGNNTVYMLGSIHMATTEIYPISDKVMDAFQSSDALVLELNPLDYEGAMSLNEIGVYSDGTTLKDHVSAETYQRVITLAEKYGYTEDIISMLKPWYVDTLFSAISYTASGNEEDATQSASLGIDMNFMMDAYIYEKPILEIEGYKYQAEVLNSFSDELQEYLLNSTIDSVNNALEGNNESTEFLESALDMWHAGDSESFKDYVSEDEGYADISASEQALIDEYEYKLMTQRDLGMANYIDDLLKKDGTHTYFVVVGSAHYISDYSVLDILKERGYEITQIK